MAILPINSNQHINLTKKVRSPMKVVNRLKTPRSKQTLSTENAEKIAVSGFTFLTGEPEYFSKFISTTGVDLADIAEIAGEPVFLTAVLAYFLTDDSLLLSFCEHNNLPPEDVLKAHMVLGGDSVVG